MSAVLPIDDDEHIPQAGGRQHRFLRGWFWSVAVGGGALGLVLLVTAPLLLLLWVPLLAVVLHDARTARDLTRPVVRPGGGSVVLGDDGLTVDHAALLEPVALAWRDIRSFAVEPALPFSNWRVPRHQLFPLHRRAGIGHPLDEPRSFLDSQASDRGVEEVRLVSVDAGRLLPNVVLLFSDRRAVGVAAPPWADDQGWIPGIRPSGGRSMTGASRVFQREVRRLHPAGLYLRILDPAPLRDALVAHGIREGLDCTDWVFATGGEHQDL